MVKALELGKVSVHMFLRAKVDLEVFHSVEYLRTRSYKVVMFLPPCLLPAQGRRRVHQTIWSSAEVLQDARDIGTRNFSVL